MLATERQSDVLPPSQWSIAMPRFRIIPSDDAAEPIEIESLDAGSALYTANQIGCHEADVLEEGIYLFSVRTLGGKSSFWQIFQRQDGASDSMVVPLD